MAHFTDEYTDQVKKILHDGLMPTWFYKQEIMNVSGVVTGLFITYDGIRDDSCRVVDHCSWDEFLLRIHRVDPDWDVTQDFLKDVEQKRPEFTMGGWLSRTIHILKAGQHPEHWTASDATKDITALLTST
jgi:hypothetical protein